MTTISIENDDVGLCSRCLCAKPANEFRRRRKGDTRRQSTCRQCHSAVERERRAFHRARSDQATVRKFVCTVKAAPTSAHIGLLVCMVERELGGPQRMAEEWVKHFCAASLKPGGRRVLDFLAAVMRLGTACAELRPKPNFDSMTDDELREAHERLLAEYLTENLPTVFQTLRGAGWTITPPSACEDAPTESGEGFKPAASFA